MGSILGEKWYNATAADITAIDAQISAKLAQIAKATAEYEKARAALTACYGLSQSQCLAKTGGYAHSTWSPIYETRPFDIAQYNNELKTLQDRRARLLEDIAASNVTTSGSLDIAGKAAVVESAEVVVTAKKYGVYIAIGAGLVAIIIGGIYAFKKFRKK